METIKKQVLNGYEVLHSTTIGGTEIVIGQEYPKIPQNGTYMVACGRRVPIGISGITEHETMMVGSDYLQAMREYIDQIERQVNILELDRAKRALPQTVFTTDNCIKNSADIEYTGRVLVFRHSALAPEYRSQSHQLVYATGGRGCLPDANGAAKVFYIELYTGEKAFSYRDNFAGIIEAVNMPVWAQKRLEAIKLLEKDNTPPAPGRTNGQRGGGQMER